jgi:CDGSH-type Zn-finger protein
MSRPETLITPYRDGPLLVRGPVRIQSQDGEEIRIDRAVVALCRCGKSRSRPLCDGTHKLVQFRAPSALENGREAGGDPEPASLAATNGSGGSRNGLGH